MIVDTLTPAVTGNSVGADILFVFVEVLRPSQPNGVMLRADSLPYNTFTGQAWSSKRLTSIVHILLPETDLLESDEGKE